jgi:hypothetical protein
MTQIQKKLHTETAHLFLVHITKISLSVISFFGEASPCYSSKTQPLFRLCAITSNTPKKKNMPNALRPNRGQEKASAVFQPINMALPCSNGQEQGSPLTIFRDSENEISGCSLQLVKRANPIGSSMDNSFSSSTTTTTATTQDCHNEEDDLVWTDAQQRVISPFPGDEFPDEMPPVDSWNVDEPIDSMDFTHFFPAANSQVMQCDDFSLSSACEDDLVLADDLTNPESFWESASRLDRSASPAQISVGSLSTNAVTLIFPPSPTSTTQLPQESLPKLFHGSTTFS